MTGRRGGPGLDTGPELPPGESLHQLSSLDQSLEHVQLFVSREGASVYCIRPLAEPLHPWLQSAWRRFLS